MLNNSQTTHLIYSIIVSCADDWLNFDVWGVGGAVRSRVVGTIVKEERPPWGQLWMEQYLISLKYWPI